MKWTPRRILLHVIIVLATLGLPLLLPSSCGPAVHSSPDSRKLKLTHYLTGGFRILLLELLGRALAQMRGSHASAPSGCTRTPSSGVPRGEAAQGVEIGSLQIRGD